MKTLSNERGMILIIALMFIVIIGLIGTAAMNITAGGLKSTAQYKLEKQAFMAAESGISEVITRLQASTDTINDPDHSDMDWIAFLRTDPTWTNPIGSPTYYNSLSTGFNYVVSVRHKLEFDAVDAGHASGSLHYNDGDTYWPSVIDEDNPGNVIRYGYQNVDAANLSQYTVHSGWTYAGKPVYVLESHGTVQGITKGIHTELLFVPNMSFNQALYARVDSYDPDGVKKQPGVTVNGSLTIDGVDACNPSHKVAPIYTLSPADTNLNGVSYTFTGDPETPVSGDNRIAIEEYVDLFRTSESVIITDDMSGGTLPDDVYYFQSSPSNEELKMNNIVGEGVLLVDGDLELGGGFDWTGLILCTGAIKFAGGGSAGINILGSVLAADTATVSGTVNITYSSCAANKGLAHIGKYKIINWRLL